MGRPFRRQRCDGQATVEFALLAPLFFLLVIGIVDFGRAVYFYNCLLYTSPSPRD